MNKYDLEHITTAHPVMSREEWKRVYDLAWKTYYTPEHIETVMRRAAACGLSVGRIMFLMIWFWGCVTIEHVHPLQGGYLRRRARVDRRPGFPIEPAVLFYPKYLAELVVRHVKIAALAWRLGKIRRALKRDPAARQYQDLALTPVAPDELDTLELFTATDAARAAAGKAKTAIPVSSL